MEISDDDESLMIDNGNHWLFCQISYIVPAQLLSERHCWET